MISPAIERVKPAIHLNGSGRDNLRKQAKERYAAAKKLHEVIMETRCHRRDYYPLGDAAWDAAEAQYRNDLDLAYELVNRMMTDYYLITCAEDEFGRKES